MNIINQFTKHGEYQTKRLDIMKKGGKNLDRLFKMPPGEKLASTRIQEFKQKKKVDIRRLLNNASTEVKFRERYEG